MIHIEDILRNKAIYFNFQNMTALCDSNAEKLIFRLALECQVHSCLSITASTYLPASTYYYFLCMYILIYLPSTLELYIEG